MKDLRQLMKENNVTDEEMYKKYKAFRVHMSKNHNFSMSLRMSFDSKEQFVLAALGLNYLNDALSHKMEDPQQIRMFQ